MQREKRYLFLGDSITDCSHCFTEDGLGNGFVKMIQRDRKEKGDDPKIVNAGTDGFTVYRVLERAKRELTGQCDTYDYVTILAGINDVCALMEVCSNGESRERIEYLLAGIRRDCENLILAVLLHSPDARVLVCEPFLGKRPEYLKNWEPIRARIAGIWKELCRKYRIEWMELQNELSQEAGSVDQYFSFDGVHPTQEGHRKIAELWMRKMEQ